MLLFQNEITVMWNTRQ